MSSEQLSAVELLAADEELFWAVFEQHYTSTGRELPVPSEAGARWPAGGRRISAHQLFVAVNGEGGYRAASQEKATWWSIAESLGVPQGLAGTLSYQVRQLYETRFLSLEDAMRELPATAIAGTDRSLRARKSTRSGSTTTAGPAQVPPPPPPSSLPPPSNPSPSPLPPSSVTNPRTGDSMAGQQPEAMYTFVLDTPSNRRGVFSANPEDPETLPSYVEPALAAVIPEKTPRIYNHCVRGLESGIPREVDFALHHLVIISDERGDKFRFRDFPLLAENLTEKVLEISKLVHGVTWDLDYDYPDPKNPKPINTLNAAIGTYDILERLKRLPVILPADNLETAEFANELRLIKEAALVLRNMCMLDENAAWLEDIEIVRDCATIVFNLPKRGCFVELKNHMFEVVEQSAAYWEIWDNDPLYLTLIEYIHSRDRFHILMGLNSLTMFALATNQNKRLVNIPMKTINTLMQLYLLDQDPELLSSILDFFYQYTMVRENVDAMRNNLDLPKTFIKRMASLLTYDADYYEVTHVDEKERRAPPQKEILMPPPDLYIQLARFNEPERTSRWLKCCLVEDTECEVTQLALWHAYQNCFAEIRVPGVHSLGTLQATDFISTVTNTFPSAEAKIVEGPSAKFIIKGIRPLEHVYNMEGYPYHYCKWGKDSQQACNYIFLDPKELEKHVFKTHLNLDSDAPGGWQLLRNDPERTAICCWDDCQLYRTPTHNIARVAGHVTLHMPPAQDMSAPPPVPERPIIKNARSRVFEYYPTAVDENGEPYGIAYKAFLIMRHISRNLPSGPALPKYTILSWTTALFASIRPKLKATAELNPTLREPIRDFVYEIDNLDKP